MYKKIIVIILLILILMIAVMPIALAEESLPYDTYTYDYWEYIVFTPAAYIPGINISGADLGIESFRDPQGMFVTPDDVVYIADTGNDRIVILEPDLKTIREIIETFDNNGIRDSFNKPRGIAVADNGNIYIADTENRRIITLDDQRQVIKTIQNPQSDLLEGTFEFMPLKVAVDFAGRVFVVARHMFQGIMTFNTDGDFIGFYGTIDVTITLWQRFWRVFSTMEQRARQQLFIPTEFTGLDVDPMGFVYATNIDPLAEQAVRRLNPRGDDVIRTGENSNLAGDIFTMALHPSNFTGPSNIIDVTYRGSGIYSILDSRRGRIFTYDHEGNLLYVFGGLGTQVGTFRTPSAIGAQKSRILVLDAARNELTTFEPTKYGELINYAISMRFDGDEAKAVEAWREVLLLNENFELANAGIGRAYLTAGDNAAAMHYLRLGMDRRHYAIAFRRYRNEVLRDSIGIILTVSVLVAGGLVTRTVLRRKKSGEEYEGGLG